MKLKTPPVKAGYIPFQGGYDSMTPEFSSVPGRCRRAQNFYQDVNGGYLAFQGYERFDGRVEPSNASFATLTVSLTATVSVNDIVTDGAGNGTVIAVAADESYLVLTKITGTYGSGAITVGGSPVGTCTGPQAVGYAPTALLGAQYQNLAADLYRADIGKVGGASSSGSVLAVFGYGDNFYAIRNNAGGTAADMWVEGGSGWTQCDLGHTLNFDAGSAAFVVDGTLTGATSGATATIKRVVLQSGAWNNGDLVTNGTFAADSDWTKGANWTIAAGVATHAAGATAVLSQALVITAGDICLVTFTVSSRTAGTITAKVGGTLGTARSTNATFTEQIVAGSSGLLLEFVPDTNFDGSLDTVTCRVLDATGYLVLYSVANGPYQNNEAITSAAGAATANGASAANTLQPSGTYEIIEANFTASTATSRIYGVDGAGVGWEWDGAVFTPIYTGMTVDKPEHVYEHKGHLFYSFYGSVQHSSPGEPYSWSPITGAAELGLGDRVTGFTSQPGQDGSSSLAIFSRNSTYTLYGTGVADWSLIPFKKEGAGALAHTIQRVGDIFMMDDRGLTRLQASQAYGNFQDATITQHIHDWIIGKRGAVTCSTISRDRNLYMLFFSDKTALFTTIKGGKPAAMMPMLFPVIVKCCTSYEDSNGNEVIAFGDENGYVYKMWKGTSFDGTAIEAYAELTYAALQTPTVRKRYRTCELEGKGTGYYEFTFSYSMEYATTRIEQNQGFAAVMSLGAGLWDSGETWDTASGVWDNSSLTPESFRMNGCGKNISLKIYSNTDYCDPVRFSGALLRYSFCKEVV